MTLQKRGVKPAGLRRFLLLTDRENLEESPIVIRKIKKQTQRRADHYRKNMKNKLKEGKIVIRTL